MNIFFDVDQTILGMDSSLRPSVKEVMRRLVDNGHDLYLWSGMGVRSEVVKRHELGPILSGVYQKPLYDHNDRLSELGVPLVPDFVVDDDPAVVVAFGGIWVSPYYSDAPDDEEMDRVYRVATDYARTGISDDAHFRSKGSVMPLK